MLPQPPSAAINPKPRSLLVDAFRRRRKSKIEIARLQRVLVIAQGRVVRWNRDRETRRQPPIEQPGTFQLIEARQIAKRIEPEMRQESLARAVGHGAPWRLAASARPDPTGLQQHVDRS